MARYHVNPETGVPGKCSAQVQCKFADSESGTEPIHFPNKAAANAYVEAKLAEEMEEMPSTVSSKSKEKDESKSTPAPKRRETKAEKEERRRVEDLEMSFALIYDREDFYPRIPRKSNLKNNAVAVGGATRDEVNKGWAIDDFAYNLEDYRREEELAMQHFDPKVKRKIVNRTDKPIYVVAAPHDDIDVYEADPGDPRGSYYFSIYHSKEELNKHHYSSPYDTVHVIEPGETK